MNINQLKQSKYLKTSDIPEPVLVTIDSIGLTNVAKEGEREDKRPIVQFKELEKPMVFNATNLKRTAKALDSDETDDWVGKQIVVYTDEDVEYAGEIVGGLRVRAAKKKAAPTKTLADMDSDIPFNNPYKGRLSYVV